MRSRTRSRGLAPAPLAAEMHDHDDGSGRWEVGGLFAAAPDAAGLALLARLHGAPDFAVERVEDRDWVAQVRAELTPVEAGRFVVYGSHDRARRAAEPDRAGDRGGAGLRDRSSRDDPGMPHGARPAGAARAGPRRVADIGGGTGVLAMAAASVWPARAWRATSTRWRPRRRAPTSRRTGSAAAWPASPPRGSGTRGSGGGALRARSSPTSWRGRSAAGAGVRRAPGAGGRAILSGSWRGRRRGCSAVYRGWGYRPRSGRGSANGRRWCCAAAAEPSAAGEPLGEVGDLAAVQADVAKLRRRKARAASARSRGALRQAANERRGTLDERDEAEGGRRPRAGRSGWVVWKTDMSFLPRARPAAPLAGRRSGAHAARYNRRFLHACHAFRKVAPNCRAAFCTPQSLGGCSGFVLRAAARQTSRTQRHARHRHRPGSSADRLGHRRCRRRADPPCGERRLRVRGRRSRGAALLSLHVALTAVLRAWRAGGGGGRADLRQQGRAPGR